MNPSKTIRLFIAIVISFFVLLIFTASGLREKSVNAVPSTLNDFFLPGSQPMESGTFKAIGTCNCHEWVSDNPDEVPMFNWQGSMMALAQRDPLYLACMAVSNQDAPEVGDLCIRCHTPVGWLEGRSLPTDGSSLTADDREGVQCHFCHKMVKPTEIGVNPYAADPNYNVMVGSGGNATSTYLLDQNYLQTLSSVIPGLSANGMYICESDDKNRRGPYAHDDSDAKHDNPYSPFHTESDLCGTCHDVSNPAFSAVKDDEGNYIKYIPNNFDAPAPDFSPYEMFPVERTFSEWKMSAYNTSPTGVPSDDFGGNKANVSTCQDCHMKDITGYGASNTKNNRTDLPHHDMTGGNTFMPDVIASIFPGEVNVAAINAGKARALYMLQHAAKVELNVSGSQLDVKVTNETGHKLPSGYPEGRRIWLNVKAYDVETQSVYESGNYNFETAVLEKEGTKIYAIKPGISAELAPIVGLPEGPSFHFVLNNEIFSDNRIPPRGFTNANFEAIQSPPVNYTYVDGQHWDNTQYELPFVPDYIEVTLYYQTVSKEYVEFLRDENVTNEAGNLMYNKWIEFGKSAPEVMNHEVWSSDPGITLLRWLGSEDTDWNNPNNWDLGVVPDASTNVIIPRVIGQYPVMTGSSNECNFLILESGSQLTVPNATDLTVFSGLIMRDGRYGIASLVEYGTLDVQGFVDGQLQLNEDRWHYFSSPLAGQTANNFFGYYLYTYDPLNGQWNNIVDENTPIEDGTGYKVWTHETDPGIKSVSFRGPGSTIHNGSYNLPVSYSEENDNYSFVGNPYFSSIDWNDPSWTKTNIGASVYVWNGVQYIAWNGSIGDLTGGIIPAMQGFFVSDAGGVDVPILTVTNDARTHGPHPYKKTEGLEVLNLRVEGNGYYDNVFVHFNQSATEGFDTRFDAFKIMGKEEAPQLYTLAENDKLRINVMPATKEDVKVDVNLITPAPGEYAFKISGVLGISQYNSIFLEDKQEDKMIDIQQVKEYTFHADPLDHEARFALYFKDSSEIDSSFDNVVIYAYQSRIYVEALDGTDSPEKIEVYNLAGQNVFATSLQSLNKNVVQLNSDKGIYLVKVYTPTKVYSKKVYIQ